MAICRDKFTRHMNRLGYNVVRHPREGIRPLDLIGLQKNTVRQLGRVDQLVRSPNGALPALIPDEQATDINGTSTASMRFAVGVQLLGSVLKALGGDIGVTVQYKAATRLRFSFSDVYISRVQPLDVSNHLRNGDIDEDSPLIDQYVAGNGRLFVVTRVAKSNKLTVSTETAMGGEVKLDVAAIKAIVGGGLNIGADSESASTISYAGDKQLVFGFECFEIGVEDGELTMSSARAGSTHLADGSRQPPPPTILDPDNLLDFAED